MTYRRCRCGKVESSTYGYAEPPSCTHCGLARVPAHRKPMATYQMVRVFLNGVEVTEMVAGIRRWT